MFEVRKETIDGNFMVPVLYHVVNTSTMEIVLTFRTKRKADLSCNKLNGVSHGI